MSPYSPRATLAKELRVVNVAYANLDAEAQERVGMVPMDSLEAALKGEDDDRAFAAVAEWSHRQLEAIRVVAR